MAIEPGRSGAEPRVWVLVAALVVLGVLYNVPYGAYLVYPLKLFSTWIHEMSHGLAAILVGGRFDHLILRADTSGLAMTAMPEGRLARGFVASAGYLGTTLAGALMVASQPSRRAARLTLMALALALLVSVVLWVRSVFGAFACLLMGAALLWLARRPTSGWHAGFLQLLGAQTCIQAVLNIRTLYSVDGHPDAQSLASLFFLPAWFWATLWMALSLVVLYLALRRAFARGRQAAPGALAGLEVELRRAGRSG